MKRMLTLLLGVLLGTIPLSGNAAWPEKPVTLLVGFPPGGTTDVLARLLADRLARDFAQRFVVENRSGANGDIAVQFAARAAPDGHLLLVSPDSIIALPALRPTATDPLTQFAPIMLLAEGPIVLVENPALGARSVPGLIALAKGKSQLSYATSGIGSTQHYAGELFKASAGLDIAHVPYRGGGQAVTDIVGNQISLAVLGVAPLLQHIKGGRLTALAITGSRRLDELPDVPTFPELGFKDLDMTQWLGLLAPAGTPAPVVATLNSALTKILGEQEIRAKLLAIGNVPAPGTPEQFAALMKKDLTKYSKLVSQRGIKPE